MKNENFFTVKEFCNILDTTPKIIHKWIKQTQKGKMNLPYYGTKRKDFKFIESEVYEWLNQYNRQGKRGFPFYQIPHLPPKFLKNEILEWTERMDAFHIDWRNDK